MDSIVSYILSFLFYGNNEAARLVGYTDDPTQWDNYKLIIIPNGHLCKDWVYPHLSNPKREGKFITLDLVYNTAFFISRAEELLETRRDRHNRFLAKYSILGQQSNLQIPLVDEYSRFLIKSLKYICDESGIDCPAKLPQEGFSHIWLTHDVDTLTRYRSLRGALGGIVRGHTKQVVRSLNDINNDPAYTFPWLIEQDKTLVDSYRQSASQCVVQPLYFFKDTCGRGYDYPQYKIHGRDCTMIRTTIASQGALLGWHSSYYGTRTSHNTEKHRHKEHNTLNSISIDYRLHRSHYLCCNIDKIQSLVEQGVTDDFSMGFADMVGFRLQTTRPVRWINPVTMQLTSLVLHPLTAMDATLSDYMNLSEDEAYYLCERLFDKIRQYNGEIVLLWHNDRLNTSYYKNLYSSLLKVISEEL